MLEAYEELLHLRGVEVGRKIYRPWVHEGEKLELTPPDKVPSRPHLQKIHGSETMHPNTKR